MPNYIHNILRIQSQSPNQTDFHQILGKKFSFENTVPPPAGKGPMLSIADSEWTSNNWGTKWDAIEPIIVKHINNTLVEITFSTAWSAPDKWLTKVSKLFPNIICALVWSDEDYPVSGYLTAQQGAIIENVDKSGDEGVNFIKKYLPQQYQRYNPEYELYNIINNINKELGVELDDWRGGESYIDYIFKDQFTKGTNTDRVLFDKYQQLLKTHNINVTIEKHPEKGFYLHRVLKS